MSWLLYEITRNPKDQERLYQEISNTRERVGPGINLTANDYDSMPFFNAVIKVCVTNVDSMVHVSTICRKD